LTNVLKNKILNTPILSTQGERVKKFVETNNAVFICEAQKLGSATSENVWRIRRIIRESDGTVTEEFASVNPGTIQPSRDYTFIADNKLTFFASPPAGLLPVEPDVTARGELEIFTPDFFGEVSAGAVPGHQQFGAFGRNQNVGSTIFETIWAQSTAYTGFITTAGVVSVVSADANDIAAGTGARTIKIIGLDPLFNLITETIPLNGTTPVTTTALFLRAWLGDIEACGTSGFNEGTITGSIGGNLTFVMPAEKGSTQVAVKTVPAGFSYLLNEWGWSVESVKIIEIELVERTNTGCFRVLQSGLTDRDRIIAFAVPIIIPEKTDIFIRARSTAGTSDVSAGFNGHLRNNALL